MKDYLQPPPQTCKNEKVITIKQSVIASLRGVPLHSLAQTLQDSNKPRHNLCAREICTEKKSAREVGEKNVQTTKRVL